MNHIEQSQQILLSGRERIEQSKKLIALHKLNNHEGIQMVNKAIDKVMEHKVNGRWVNSHYESQYIELTEIRARIIDRDFPELKSYFESVKR